MKIASSRLLLLFVISLGSFMSSLDNTIVNVSLPTIAEYYQVGTGEVSLVVVAYMLVGTSLVLMFGYLGDRVGYRKIFVIGFLAFVVSSAMCGLSGGIWELIGWRGVQGLGSAMFGAILSAMVFSFFPEDERGKALAIMITMSSLAAVVGPVLGGLLTNFLSWNWVFFVNVPIGLLGAIIGLKVIPKVIPSNTGRFDTTGSLVVMVAMVLTVYYMNIGKEWGWTSPSSLAILLGAAASWLFLVWWERRNANPALDVKLFRDRGFALGSVAGFLMMAVLMGTTFVLPFYFQLIMGMNAGVTGVILLVPALASVVFGLLGPRLCLRFGDGKIAMVAAGLSALVGVGYYLLTAMTGSALWPWLVVSSIGGASAGLFSPPCTKLVMSRCPDSRIGAGSAINTTLRSIGMTTGVALYEAILSTDSPVGARVMLTAGSSNHLLQGFELAFILGTVMSLVALFAVLFSGFSSAPANGKIALDKASA
jgi:EmrB/QacA subfamily drug resistance transporter